MLDCGVVRGMREGDPRSGSPASQELCSQFCWLLVSAYLLGRPCEAQGMSYTRIAGDTW